MAEQDTWSVQVSIRTGDHMLNVRGDSFGEVKAKLAEAYGEEVARRIVDQFSRYVGAPTEQEALETVKKELGAEVVPFPTPEPAPPPSPTRPVPKQPFASTAPTQKQVDFAVTLKILPPGTTADEAARAGWTREKLSRRIDEVKGRGR